MSPHPRSISHPWRALFPAILLNICRSSGTSPLPFLAERAAGYVLSQKKKNSLSALPNSQLLRTGLFKTKDHGGSWWDARRIETATGSG